MSLLQEWREYAYSEEMQNSKEGEQLWNNYFQLEKGIYEKLLTNPTEVVTGTVEGLAEKYEVPLSMMVGFLDGINDSLKEPNPIDTMEKDTEIKLDIDCEKLYYNMVDCNAEWLYTLPQWDSIQSAEKNCTASRKIPVRSAAKNQKLEEMVRVHAEAARNTKNVVDDKSV